jgi:septal ring factor EnvC (AmiA/AmiB activator)
MLIASIAALMLLFGGGNSLENYLLHIKKPVKAAVESKVTVNEVLDLSKELGKQLKAQNKEITKLRGSILDLHPKYDAKSADIEAYIDKLITAHEEGQKQILDTRSAMKNLMTREEWTKVFSLKDD